MHDTFILVNTRPKMYPQALRVFIDDVDNKNTLQWWLNIDEASHLWNPASLDYKMPKQK
jgi:hypothetical protein